MLYEVITLQQRQKLGGVEHQELLVSDERLKVELALMLDRREEQQKVSLSIRERYSYNFV